MPSGSPCFFDFAPLDESVADMLLLQAFLNDEHFRSRFLDAVDRQLKTQLKALQGRWHSHHSVKIENDELDIVLCNCGGGSKPTVIVIENKLVGRFPKNQLERHVRMMHILVDEGELAAAHIVVVAPDKVTLPEGTPEVALIRYEEHIESGKWLNTKTPFWEQLLQQIKRGGKTQEEDKYVRRFVDAYSELAKKEYGLTVSTLRPVGACSTWLRIPSESCTICHKLNDGEIRVDLDSKHEGKWGAIRDAVKDFESTRTEGKKSPSISRGDTINLSIRVSAIFVHSAFVKQEPFVRESLSLIKELHNHLIKQVV